MTPSIPKQLYWRTAMQIGAALLAFVVLAISSVAIVGSRQLDNYLQARHSPLAQQAANILSTQGTDGLADWLTNNNAIPADVTAYVLDANGKDLLGRPLPRQLANFIRRSVVDVDPERENLRPVRLAPELIAPNQRYTFLLVPNRIGFFGNLATTLGILLAALLVIAVVAGFIARGMWRPLSEIQSAARELALGHVAARVPSQITARRDELGTLAADFNAAAEKIVALLSARQRLMGDLSHELRSPLARMKAALALMSARGNGSELTNINRIESEIGRMDAMIGDLLRYARLDAAIASSQKLVRIDSLLTDIVNANQIVAAEKDCRVQLEVADNLVVIGDPELLRSALENVLRNAIHFCAAQRAVEVVAGRHTDRVHITISDQGQGVPQDALERMFEPFVRLETLNLQPNNGTGLGLAIAKRAIVTHHGSIVAANRAGGGLTVAITLPLIEA